MQAPSADPLALWRGVDDAVARHAPQTPPVLPKAAETVAAVRPVPASPVKTARTLQPA